MGSFRYDVSTPILLGVPCPSVGDSSRRQHGAQEGMQVSFGQHSRPAQFSLQCALKGVLNGGAGEQQAIWRSLDMISTMVRGSNRDKHEVISRNGLVVAASNVIGEHANSLARWIQEVKSALAMQQDEIEADHDFWQFNGQGTSSNVSKTNQNQIEVRTACDTMLPPSHGVRRQY